MAHVGISGFRFRVYIIMSVPVGPEYIPYTSMDPLGKCMRRFGTGTARLWSRDGV